MAGPAAAVPELSEASRANALLDILERSLHASASEWLFLRELRVGTGRRPGNAQRLDAFALNSLPHTGMKRVCYEIKTSRTDFLLELKHPLKRRIGSGIPTSFTLLHPRTLSISAKCRPSAA